MYGLAVDIQCTTRVVNIAYAHQRLTSRTQNHSVNEINTEMPTAIHECKNLTP